ncbi:MAG: carboxymuconolactone decarboxylase family protein [Rubripirellula sp.]
MPHVKPLTIDEAPEDSKPILKAIKEKFGQSLNLFNSLAHQPDVLGGVTQINDGLQNDLPAKYRELAYYKASQLNACDYCSHYHRQAAKKVGLSDAQLDSMNADSDNLFDAKEKIVIKYAEQLTEKANVDASVVAKLKEFLDDRQLVTLAAAVALANFTNRVNHGLGVELP